MSPNKEQFLSAVVDTLLRDSEEQIALFLLDGIGRERRRVKRADDNRKNREIVVGAGRQDAFSQQFRDRLRVMGGRHYHLDGCVVEHSPDAVGAKQIDIVRTNGNVRPLWMQLLPAAHDTRQNMQQFRRKLVDFLLPLKHFVADGMILRDEKQFATAQTIQP